MKKIIVFFILITVISCKQDIPPIGEPFSQLEGLSDTWKLVSIVQTDEIAKTRLKELDLSGTLVGNLPSQWTFNLADKSYTLDKGTSAQFVPASGNWAFDDDKYPSKIILSSGGNTYELKLLAPVRPDVDKYLIVKYTRPANGCTGIPETGVVGYVYKYERQ